MMFEDTLDQYQRLIDKQTTIERNKQEVLNTIEFLNEKKNNELQQTWQVVSHNMAEIFSTLLPGAMAKLSMHNPEGVEHGLELKVGFNNSWKQSLSELSGG